MHVIITALRKEQPTIDLDFRSLVRDSLLLTARHRGFTIATRQFDQPWVDISFALLHLYSESACYQCQRALGG